MKLRYESKIDQDIHWPQYKAEGYVHREDGSSIYQGREYFDLGGIEVYSRDIIK